MDVLKRVDISLNLPKTVDQGTVRSHDPFGPQHNQHVVAQNAIPNGSASALNKQRRTDSWEHVARGKKSWSSQRKKRGKSLLEVVGERVDFDPNEMSDLLDAIACDEALFAGAELPDLAELEAFFRGAGLEDAAPQLALLLYGRWAAKSYGLIARRARELARSTHLAGQRQQRGHETLSPFGTIAEMRDLFAGMGFTEEGSSFVVYCAVTGCAADVDIGGSGFITCKQLAGRLDVQEEVAADLIRDWNVSIHPDAPASADGFQRPKAY